MRLVQLLVVAACTPAPDGATDASSSSSPPERDWSEVADVVEHRCTGCHSPDRVAPFSMTRWEDVQRTAPAMGVAIETRAMPPWPATDADVHHVGDRRLTDTERSLLLDWIDAGAPAWGDPPRALTAPPAPELTRVDLRLEMPEAYVPQTSPDDIRCFLLELPGSVSGYVVESRIAPGNRSLVHHANFVDFPSDLTEDFRALQDADPEPGWDCNQWQPGARPTLAVWLPGHEVLQLPRGTGLPVEPDAAMLLVVHYWEPAYDGVPDRSAVELMIEDEVQEPLGYVTLRHSSWRNGPVLEKGETTATHAALWDIEDVVRPLTEIDARNGVLVHSVMLHMHDFGDRGRMVRERDGSVLTLLDIDRWDFDWQLDYALQEPVEVLAGDALGVSCTHHSHDGQRVMWGDTTEDEMCNGRFLLGARP
ncbi:MAG: hypothetical protein KTR31_34545 [Myxococcales bacterium]|nr:hypothetical protein [Myxococcales bacterium]